MSAVLSVNGLVKRFAGVAAIAGLDFTVQRGECFGLLGPNGAGKSTTLKSVLGLVEPDAGRIRLLGLEIPAQAREARARVGVVPQADALDPDFTVAENLVVFGRYFGLSRAVLEARLDGLLGFAGLAHKRDAKIHELSGGMRRRLTLARALVNDPEVLFLDEPTTGLDPQARHLVWERLRQLLAAGKTIVLTTHFMEEAERLCTRVAIIDGGRLIAMAAPADLVASQIEPHVVEASGDGVDRWAREQAPTLAARVELVGETAFAYCTSLGQAAAVEASASGAAAATAGGACALRVLRRPANLEDVFLELTGRSLRD
ncbi:MAG: ATP-binding cassette domain-containing protein [Burkholderiaceae bacterium]|nr:ATP-binding cassette domain-containing protein [Burkholderiaceae bacterium]MEB2350223.1 ATP-binding cassette domain-containing protein [Burkholderiaceae bacterium]